eukprot:Gb_20963 [translate_table: standard]
MSLGAPNQMTRRELKEKTFGNPVVPRSGIVVRKKENYGGSDKLGLAEYARDNILSAGSGNADDGVGSGQDFNDSKENGIHKLKQYFSRNPRDEGEKRPVSLVNESQSSGSNDKKRTEGELLGTWLFLRAV